jgi:hypothetical protein
MSSIAFTMPAVITMLLKLRYELNSNPTLSAMLFKINELFRIQNPLSGPLSSFGMSDMQFCNAHLRAVKPKPTDWESVFDAKEEFCRPRSVRPLLERRTKSHTVRRARLRLMACRFAAQLLGPWAAADNACHSRAGG